MSMAMALPGNSDSTFLTHLLARGLEDERYVVERFQAMADGDIRRLPGDAAPAKGRRNAKRTIATVKAVKEMRPARTEIIVCTGLRIKGSGIQYWPRGRAGQISDKAMVERPRGRRERGGRRQLPSGSLQPVPAPMADPSCPPNHSPPDRPSIGRSHQATSTTPRSSLNIDARTHMGETP